VYERLQTRTALAAVASTVVVVMFISWAPAPEGFVVAAGAALAWCRWAEAHPTV
jgi:hypothetical protein